MGIFNTLSFVVVVLIVALIFYALFGSAFRGVPFINNLTTTANLSYTTVTTAPYVTQNQAVAYALMLINNDRENYSLGNVTLSPEPSAQQHAASMLVNNYFSHWDTYGMKPYMRYTLLGGNGSVTENIAYMYNSSGIDVLAALKNMEYNFVYNDQECCANGHRDNILNQYHNLVSVGVAYNSTSVYFVEDFINQYITWIGDTPGVSSSGTVSLKGVIANGYSLSGIQFGYDAPVQNLTMAQLKNTPYNDSYGYGQTVGGVGYSKGNIYFYYTNTTTINATTYTLQGQNFNVAFSLQDLIQKYGAGEYTIFLQLNGTTGSFIGSTYTVFVNSQGKVYRPISV